MWKKFPSTSAVSDKADDKNETTSTVMVCSTGTAKYQKGMAVTTKAQGMIIFFAVFSPKLVTSTAGKKAAKAAKKTVFKSKYCAKKKTKARNNTTGKK